MHPSRNTSTLLLQVTRPSIDHILTMLSFRLTATDYGWRETDAATRDRGLQAVEAVPDHALAASALAH